VHPAHVIATARLREADEGSGHAHDVTV
jgi:hypothetical protein